MNFSINPLKYGSVFVLPAEITDKYMKTCSGAFVKVLLVLYRVAPAELDAAALASRAGVSPDDAADALLFWEKEGFIKASGAEIPQTELKTEIKEELKPAQEPDLPREAAPVQTEAPPAVKKTKLRPVLPSYKQVHDRIVESSDVRVLFSEAQEYLGRTIGLADQSSLLLLYDYYGLPTDIILMICGYASQQGKSGNMRYITAVGESWSEREIDTDEKAQAELKRLESTDAHWEQLRSVTGIRSVKPTKTQGEYVSKWYEAMGFTTEMLGIAFAKMSERTEGMSFSYMDKILSRWHEAGIKTPEAVEKNEAEFEAKKAQKAEKRTAQSRKTEVEGGFSSSEASYDIEKAMEKAFTVPKTTKKRRK